MRAERDKARSLSLFQPSPWTHRNDLSAGPITKQLVGEGFPRVLDLATPELPLNWTITGRIAHGVLNPMRLVQLEVSLFSGIKSPSLGKKTRDCTIQTNPDLGHERE